MIFLCFSSFLFHASLTEIGRRLDITMVVASAMIPFSYSILRLFGMIDLRQSKLFYLRTYKMHILLMCTAWMLFYFFDAYGRELTFSLIILTTGVVTYTQLKYSPSINFKYFLTTIFLIFFAYVIWQIDNFYCDPTHWFQTHAVWHIMTATSIFFVYLFFRSELLFEESRKITQKCKLKQ
jgi:hypothetical protein